MTRKILLGLLPALAIISGLLMIGFIEIQNASAQEDRVPEWVKQIAKWWSEGLVSTTEFLNAMGFLLTEQIIPIEGYVLVPASGSPSGGPISVSDEVPIGTIIDWWCSGICIVPFGYMIADGTTVNDVDSPLDGQTLPDLRGKFVKGSNNVFSIGNIGGSDSHSHSASLPGDWNTNLEGEHHHIWGGFSNSEKRWYTYDDVFGIDEVTIIDWTNGIDNDGSGFYPLAISDNTARFHYSTQSGGNHVHDLPDDSFFTEQEGNLPEYVGLLKIIKIKSSSLGGTGDSSTNAAEILALKARVDALETLTMSMSADADNLNFVGVNVRIMDGTGTTACAGPCNEVGNLIVGYDEQRTAGNDKSGSHNLVIGPRHNYQSYGGLVAGSQNTVSGAHSSVTGGEYNIASGFVSSVSGGQFNVASGGESSVLGGESNEATGSRSSVSGGQFNVASGGESSVSGGQGNTASSTRSSVSGGSSNEASGVWSSVSGGFRNIASGHGSSVLGGESNEADPPGNYASVSGGQDNTASGDHSSVSGGNSRTASGPFDWVAGTLFEDVVFELPDMITKPFINFFNL